MKLVYLDLETTGLELDSSIVQICSIVTNEDKKVDMNNIDNYKLISEYCNPFDNEQMELFKENKLEEHLIASLNVSNISFETLSQANSEYNVMNKFFERLYELYTKCLINNEDIVLIGYNILNYDLYILKNSIKRLFSDKLSLELQSKYMNMLNSMKIADVYIDMKLFFDTSVSYDKHPHNFKLSTLSTLFKFKGDNYHNAETDVLATIYLSQYVKTKIYNVSRFMNDRLITFGKYRGKTLSQIEQHHNQYYEWLTTNNKNLLIN